MPLCGVTSIRWINLLQNGISHQHVLSYNPFKPWYNNSFLIYASSEKNRMLACRFGEHRDNSRNSQSVFLVVSISPLRSYFLINKDFPVISFGCSIPISSINVGAISARHPPSLKPYAGSAFTRMNGTGLVVCAVNGSPVS